jgi:hypothetical protein
MDIGVVLQNDPPARDVVELAKKAEAAGFSHVWTFDSHVLWQEPFVIYSKILDETERVIVGPMVTNPGTRDWTVTASLFATSTRCTATARSAASAGATRRCGCSAAAADARPAPRVGPGDPRPRERREGDRARQELQFAWAPGEPARGVGGRVRTEGPGPDRRGGRRLHPAARRPGHRGLDDRGGAEGRRAGRPRPDGDQVLRGGAGLRRRRPGAPAGADRVVRRHGRQPRGRHRRPLRRDGAVPQVLTDYIKGPAGLRLRRARPGRQHAHHVRARRGGRPVLHPRARSSTTSSGSPSCATWGVDQFAVYLQHDAKEETLAAYGSQIIPAIT